MQESQRVQVMAIVFEGGYGSQSLAPSEQAVVDLRGAIVRDSLEKLARVRAIDEVVLATDSRPLAEDALGLGARVWWTGPKGEGPEGCRTHGWDEFRFGTVLSDIIREMKPAAVLYLGGATGPLLTEEEIEEAAETLRDAPKGEGLVLANNLFSSDIVGVAPAEAVLAVAPPSNDNGLAITLHLDARLKFEKMPESLGTLLDIDTPTDAMILSTCSGLGPRTSRFFAEAQRKPGVYQRLVDRSRLDAVAKVLSTPMAEIGLFGRVSPKAIEKVNAATRCRVRALSEERGMRSLGRAEAGTCDSLLGRFMEELGPWTVVRHIAEVCSAALIDTRPLFSHRGRRVSKADRFYSDLLMAEEVREAWARGFTEACREAGIPIILGGHSLLSGGLAALLNIAQAGGSRRNC